MRRFLIALAAVLVIPLATLIYLKLFDGKVVIVRNSGAEKIDVSVTINSGGVIERTELRSVPAGSVDWIMFYPRTKGMLIVHCTSVDHIATVSLAGGLGGASVSNLKLDGCRSVISRSGFAL